MKAVILASGEGKRLRPLTNSTPKILVQLGEKTILDHEIENLKSAGIKKILITTGPFEDKVIDHVNGKYPDLKTEFVRNPEYKTTNAIYSLWLAGNKISEDVILMHGDMVFDPALLMRLLESPEKNCVLVNRKLKPEKDFKAVVAGGAVKKIGVEFFGSNAYFLAPIYKFSLRDFRVWLKEIDMFVREGKTDLYAESAFNAVSDRIRLAPVYYESELCMEIDDRKDLLLARRLLSQQKQPFY